MQRREFVLVFGLTSLLGCSGARSEAPESISQHDTVMSTADDCLAGQDMNADDVDIARCPALPEYPEDVLLGTEPVSLGAWEIGTTANGDTYKYGSLTSSDGGPMVLNF